MAVEITKKEGESNESAIRRFTRKVQSSGFLLQAKQKMFVVRKPNKRKVRESAIRRKQIQDEREILRKTGKLDENTDKYGRQKAPSLKIKIKK
ncbi:MAG: 30S ribosomal protein S21 [Patescibacteria group bacterium]